MEGSSADDKTPRGRNVAHARGGNMGGTFPMRSPGKAGAGGGQQQHQHRDKKGHHHHYHHSKHNLGTLQKLLPWITIGLLSLIALVLLGSALFPGYIFMCPETIKRLPEHCVKLESDPVQHDWVSAVLPLDCLQAPQSSPVIAHRVDDVKYDFFLSLLDFGTRRRPNRNMVRLMEDRPFLKPELAVAMQSVLEMLIEAKAVRPDSLVIDAGAGIGAAAFAAAAMGVRVLALDPVLANVLKMCDAVHLNRVSKRVKLHLAAVSDSVGNITIHNILSNLEHSAVTAAVLTLASKDAPVIPTTVESLPIDSLVLPDQHVAVLKVTVQGWELHAFRGAAGLLSRPPKEAPFVLYEEDRMLLRAGNTTPAAVRGYLAGFGYTECDQAHGLVHCRKKGSLLDV
ncbi:unnamed protein product [Closterium sp. Yama58-4]|nr:unnamed protein product [Closterium sp. Yama58-4]